MSGDTSPSDPAPSDRDSGGRPSGTGGAGSPAPRPEYLVALFTTVLWAAAQFAVGGMIALIADRDPVPAGVSLFAVPIATLLAGVALWFVTARSAIARSPWGSALVAAAVVYLVFVVAGGLASLRLLFVQAQSPFVLVASALAAVTVLATWFGIRAYRRPR
ncbi:hypothetical protein GCM10027515_15210 [Schumannella luteola]|uniref:ABC-type transport system involved in multi-copper enzyme maturation permease subunit n=1 Tax=Schumannella luteola TaxID=472059 RepID=A0A852YSK0_9MICO|nr:hypothetical protein [Schumannella luteola]NYH00680.1 ABC-type transport system involved in multi-copper enzyme maturation permease subunit [Schumannella luteola]TPX04502.1 hypothetical protein FJ656_11595 [Schumannella luteola]